MDKGGDLLHGDLTYRIIGLGMEVWNYFKGGFNEKVYENSMMKLFKKNDVRAAQQVPITVLFEGDEVGHYAADIFVEGKVVVEIKACDSIVDDHVAQVLNYLKGSGKKVGMILNFSKKRLEHRRVINEE